MDIMEKEVFVGAKKREKRTTLLCEKETRLHQSKVQVKTISLSFSLVLSLSLITFSLSLCYCIRLNREHDVQWKLTKHQRALLFTHF